jgi:hypothetical protein
LKIYRIKIKYSKLKMPIAWVVSQKAKKKEKLSIKIKTKE